MTTSTPSQTLQPGPRGLQWAALAVAVVALGGSLYLSLGMALKACPLCFYQRTFVMSVVAVLAMGLAIRSSGLTFLALPLAAAGLGVASFHVYLELSSKLECPGGILGFGTAPQQSLFACIVLFAVLLVAAVQAPQTGRWTLIAAGVGLGAFLAVASCVSNPPFPAVPPTPYDKPPDICRPPFPTGA